MATCFPSVSVLDPIDELHTLLDLARWRAECRPNDLAYTFLVDGDREEIHLTYGELDRRARAIAATLVEQGAVGERALLIYEPGLDYIAAFFGCIYASVIAVPVYPPDPMRLHRMLPRLQAVIRDAQARWILSTSTIRDQVGPFFRQSGENVQCLATDVDMVAGCEEDWVSPNVQGSSLAYLQYTSGSTGLPKGVMVSHANVLHNVQQMHRLDEPDPVGVNWTPPYHDMGLIAGDVPGDKRLVAYVAAEGNTTPSDNKPSVAGVDHVAHWEHIYDELYRRGAENHNPTFNIVGWNSSYTGLPLPAEEMRHLFDHTLARIRAFSTPACVGDRLRHGSAPAAIGRRVPDLLRNRSVGRVATMRRARAQHDDAPSDGRDLATATGQ